MLQCNTHHTHNTYELLGRAERGESTPQIDCSDCTPQILVASWQWHHKRTQSAVPSGCGREHPACAGGRFARGQSSWENVVARRSHHQFSYHLHFQDQIWVLEGEREGVEHVEMNYTPHSQLQWKATEESDARRKLVSQYICSKLGGACTHIHVYIDVLTYVRTASIGILRPNGL